MMQRVDNPEQDISTTWRKFSEVWAVASRNSLYRILATSVALGARQRAKSSSQAPLYVLGWGGEGGDCYCELPRIPIPRTSVNKYNQVRLRLLINEEHALAKAVRRGLDTGLGVPILRPTLYEDLVCTGKLARGERFASTGCDDDAHNVTNLRRTSPHIGVGLGLRGIQARDLLGLLHLGHRVPRRHRT